MPTTTSTEISNVHARPQVANAAGKDGGRVRIKQGNMEVADGDFDANDDVIRLCEIPTNAVIISIEIGSDALDAGSHSIINVGLSTRGADASTAGTIKDEDTYATLVTTWQSATALTEVTNEARDINEQGNAVWQDAGDSADPQAIYEICVYQTAAGGTDAAGTAVYRVLYAID